MSGPEAAKAAPRRAAEDRIANAAARMSAIKKMSAVAAIAAAALAAGRIRQNAVLRIDTISVTGRDSQRRSSRQKRKRNFS